MKREPISLYIHIPFCASKCHYCSFNSVAGKSRWIARYVEALIEEMEIYREPLRGRMIPTVFFGGGTPSLLAGEQIGRILDEARRRFAVTGDAEISLESNPGTLTRENLEGYRKAGVNRMSVGAQSFHPDELRWLGRAHSVEDVRRSIELLRETGFENFNLDLIFGLPGQTLGRWQESVKRAVALKSSHLSLYHLTIEEGSTFGDVKKMPNPSDEKGAELFLWTREFLAAAGFEQYEISNFARPGFRCRHNQVYWQNGDCVGIGAGAWSYLAGARYLRPKTVEEYIQDVEHRKFARLEEEQLEPQARWRETLVFGLRMRDGVRLGEIAQRIGRSPDAATTSALQRLETAGLLTANNDTVRLTDRGLLFADTVAVELL